jgi:hypothetical protein
MFVGVCVAVLVDVAVGVFVGVFVGVLVAVGIFVGVLVGVFVAVLVGVKVAVGVGILLTTLLLQLLLISLLSLISAFGSTVQTPLLGLTYNPGCVELAVNTTSNLPVRLPIVTLLFCAVQVSILLLIWQLIVPLMPTRF